MRINQLIEGISPILFHFTSLYGAGKIVSEDRFRLASAFSNPSEHQHVQGRNKYFFLSASRSRVGGYTLRGAYQNNAVLVLDGRKLERKYSGGPIQYWGRDMIALDPKYDEVEDRIYAQKPYLENATDYIDEIHLLITGDTLDANQRRSLKEIKKSKIPTFLYNEKEPFLLMDKRRAKSLRDYTFSKEPVHGRGVVYDRDATKKQQRRRNKEKEPDLSYGPERWIELMSRPVTPGQWSALGYKTRSYLYSMTSWGADEAELVLSADMHNSKNDPRWSGRFAQLMHRHNLDTPKEIVNFIVNRWKPMMEQNRI